MSLHHVTPAGPRPRRISRKPLVVVQAAQPIHLVVARRLDVEAGAELFAGHHAAAVRLAHRAAALREAGR